MGDRSPRSRTTRRRRTNELSEHCRKESFVPSKFSCLLTRWSFVGGAPRPARPARRAGSRAGRSRGVQEQRGQERTERRGAENKERRKTPENARYPPLQTGLGPKAGRSFRIPVCSPLRPAVPLLCAPCVRLGRPLWPESSYRHHRLRSLNSQSFFGFHLSLARRSQGEHKEIARRSRGDHKEIREREVARQGPRERTASYSNRRGGSSGTIDFIDFSPFSAPNFPFSSSSFH